jgi:uncharacterized Zn finger protein
MSDRPEITLKQIRARASDQSFSRGNTLYDSDSISQTVRRGDEIEARCRGSYPEPYRVWAKLNGSEITTSCTCEYDWGGDCKHIIAMLLTYLHEPARFEERQTLQDALLSRSKEDLVDIIMLMVTRYPDLQDIVDQPTPNEIVSGVVPLDTLSFRQELRDAFTSYDDYYDYQSDPMMHKIAQVSSVADRLAERGDWLNAAAVYRTILEEFADIDESYYHDEDGELGMSIDMAVSALDSCLKQSIVINNDNERRAVFDALLGVFIWDINFGGIGIGGEAPEIILKNVQREDIPSIRKLTEDSRDQRLRRQYGDWAAEIYNSFLMDLDMLDEVDPEIILERLRAQEMYHLLVSKLCEMNRVDEAITIIRENMDGSYERRRALSLLVEHGHDTKVQQVAEEILASEYSYELAEWLLSRYKASGNKEALLRWQTRQMQERPSIQIYAELKTTAQTLNQWDTLRPQIIRNVKATENYELLTQIYLHDEEWTLAWDTLSKVKRAAYYGHSLELDVANASRHALPGRAIPVFVKYARQYINNRGRGNYQQAASLLTKVQQAYDQLDEIETWETLIADLRTEFKKLPALKDELNKAGL